MNKVIRVALVMMLAVAGCDDMSGSPALDEPDGVRPEGDQPERCVLEDIVSPVPLGRAEREWPCSSDVRDVGEFKRECSVDGDEDKIEWTLEVDGGRAELFGFGWQWTYFYEEGADHHKLAYGVKFNLDGEEVGCICVWPDEWARLDV